MPRLDVRRDPFILRHVLSRRQTLSVPSCSVLSQRRLVRVAARRVPDVARDLVFPILKVATVQVLERFVFLRLPCSKLGLKSNGLAIAHC